ncbi:PIH1 domain-containing protein 1 isoform X4 [Manacus candei]|uniref:PIH1 domain-containing protein 1 isoform X4 n=1 Tax=Manacus candei TaxID=415023 RepID=UPI002227BBE2|nr:PIH1 domain-containing protein 1 isoform X4 [Manacus candei]
MDPPADPSLLSAELEAEEEEEEEALRRLLLQVTPAHEEPPPAGPARAVTPQPGLCVKTRTATGDKVFVNVCHSGEVPPPPALNPPGLQRLLRDPPGPDGAFRIPMSLGEPHAELDRGGRGCTAYDVVVNSGFFRTLQTDPLYLEFFLTVAMEGLSEKYGVELELTGWRVLKNRRFLGSISAQNIRARPQPRIQELQGPTEPPQFVVVAEPSAQHPEVLQARVLLPQIEGAGSLWLGLSEERLVLARPPGGAALLELGLPRPADPARGRARFHRRSKVLTVTVPLRA